MVDVPDPLCTHCVLTADAGSSSLALHEKRCRDLWEAREARKPLELRRRLPEPKPESRGNDVDEANAAARKLWNDTVLEMCDGCGRTFLPDRLIVHQRSCGGGATRTPMPPTPCRPPSKAPPARLCWICKRPYGTPPCVQSVLTASSLC